MTKSQSRRPFVRMLTALLVFGLPLLLAPAALAKTTTYTNGKHGYSLAIPSNWKKTKSPVAGTLFVAQRSGSVRSQWSFTYATYGSKKEAADVKSSLKTQKDTYRQLLLVELSKQFVEGCSSTGTKNVTIVKTTGLRLSYTCTSSGVAYFIRFITFVHNLTQYTISEVGVMAKQALLQSELDKITKSLVFSK